MVIIPLLPVDFKKTKMVLIPNIDTPHYYLRVDAFVSRIEDGRGFLRQKTQQAGIDLASDIYTYLLKDHFGDNASMISPSLGSHECIFENSRYRASVTMLLPSYVSMTSIDRDVKIIIGNNAFATGEFYIECVRHYTQYELDRRFIDQI